MWREKLYYTGPCFSGLFCSILYFNEPLLYVLCSALLYCNVLCFAVPCFSVLCCAVLYSTVPYFYVLYCSVLYCTVLHCTMTLHYSFAEQDENYYVVLGKKSVILSTIFLCIVLFSFVLYCIVLYCIIQYCAVLYCTVNLLKTLPSSFLPTLFPSIHSIFLSLIRSKTDQAEVLRAGRLTAMGAGNQPNLGAKKALEHEEAVIIFLRETATEMVFSLPSFITASDMREVT